MRRRILMVALAVIALGLVSAPVASAAGRTEHYAGGWTSEPSVTLDVCSFPVTIVTHVDYAGMNVWDNVGNYIHTQEQDVEQDTFTTPGHELVSDAYLFNIQFKPDASGNILVMAASGHVLRVTLPDGSVFMSAGHTDFLSQTGYVIVPDSGKAGDVAAFCAALS